MTDTRKTTDSTAEETGAHWHQRHQRGEVDGYGVYGGAQDQIPERGDPAEMADQQPRVPASSRRETDSGSHAAPYRVERVQGDSADSFYDAARGTREAGDGQMLEQFAGVDGTTPASSEARAHGESSSPGEPDQALATHVTAQLAKAGLQARDVQITCVDGIVQLHGRVADAGMKAAITQVVRSAAGNARVDDRIDVRASRGQDAQGQGLAAATDEYTVLNGRQV